MLTSVSYLHSTGVMHRDLKPQNILIDDNCQVKICDFGLSRCIVEQDGQSEARYDLSKSFNKMSISEESK